MEGIIPIWKEAGMTSHDVVVRLRKMLGTRKIGHTGTLDPGVDGVLVVCVGRATKLSDYMMDKVKTYEGQITLGFATDTEDLEGREIERCFLNQPFSPQKIQEAMKQLTGQITQIPPMYSAVKVNGHKLYEYARAGKEVERPRRRVQVDSFELASSPEYDKNKGEQSFDFSVKCGKGTYVRTLATDLGRSLGAPATMTALTRTGASPFSSKDCLTLGQIQAMLNKGDNSFLYPVDFALKDLPVWNVPDSLQKMVANGAVLNKDNLPDDLRDQLPVRAYIGGEIKGVYGQHPTQAEQMKPIKML